METGISDIISVSLFIFLFSSSLSHTSPRCDEMRCDSRRSNISGYQDITVYARPKR